MRTAPPGPALALERSRRGPVQALIALISKDFVLVRVDKISAADAVAISARILALPTQWRGAFWGRALAYRGRVTQCQRQMG